MSAGAYKLRTQGTGSRYWGEIRYTKEGDSDLNSVRVAFQDGFQDRAAALRWGRAEKRRLEGKPVRPKRADGCWNCRYREGGSRWSPGECVYPLPPLPEMPWAIVNGGFDPARPLNRIGVWPTDDDGVGCATWRAQP